MSTIKDNDGDDFHDDDDVDDYETRMTFNLYVSPPGTQLFAARVKSGAQVCLFHIWEKSLHCENICEMSSPSL